MTLLDTHAFVWLASDPARLSKPAKAAIRVDRSDLAVSVVSAWEIALLVDKGRLKLPLPVPEFVERALAHHGIRELSLERETIFRAVGLEKIHNDPFDRVLVAEALIRRAPIVTRDTEIPKYSGVTVVW